MPNSKAQRAKLERHAVENGVAVPPVRNENQNGESSCVECCSPRSCLYPQNRIDVSRPGDAVRVFCNNENCNRAPWMHKDCFEDWQDVVLSFLRTCGRARSWSEKQRLQNLWTKKGYDLAFKACDCLCGKGHLRKDLDYIPPKDNHEDKKHHRQHRAKSDKPLPELYSRSQPVPVGHNGTRPRINIRQRTTSMSSTGSSPPLSGSPHDSPTEHHRSDFTDRKFEFSLSPKQAAAGNIFLHRDNLDAFKRLPLPRRNSYHIKTEDEGPYGNDETRCFVLSNLSTNRVTLLPCVVCGHELDIYDRYPLIDGTLFLTPQRYISDVSVTSHGHTMYMNAVCMMCAESNIELRCKSCHKRWDGSTLQVGTMYSYDVFAANPCCSRRIQCKNCQYPAIEPSQVLPFFSQYSQTHSCQKCKNTAYHFVKPLSEIFYINRH